MTELKKFVDEAWEDRNLLNYKEYADGIDRIIQHLDRRELRVADPIGNRWHVNEWVKKSGDLVFSNP